MTRRCSRANSWQVKKKKEKEKLLEQTRTWFQKSVEIPSVRSFCNSHVAGDSVIRDEIYSRARTRRFVKTAKSVIGRPRVRSGCARHVCALWHFPPQGMRRSRLWKANHDIEKCILKSNDYLYMLLIHTMYFCIKTQQSCRFISLCEK